jgi:pSer/pThr/pTyr-binding forkhead associated (FHA) protein
MISYSLEVIKGGILLDTIFITKQLLKFGRHPESDIVLDHTSCSRNHAKLEENKDEKTKEIYLFLTDCGSTHGTFLNKTRIESHKPIQLENGFHIQFGESSRSFVVCKSIEIQKDDDIMDVNDNVKSNSNNNVLGTEDEEDETEEDFLQDDDDDDDDNIGLSMLHGKVIKGKKNQNKKLSWFDDLDATQLNEKEQIFFDRILSLRIKSDNLNLEIERIRSKEDTFGGRSLTEGQMKQIAKNEAAIESYQERIVKDLDSLKKKLLDRQSNLISGGIEKTKQGKGELGENHKKCQKRVREDDIDDSNSLLHDAVARDEKINSMRLLDSSSSRITPSFSIRTLGTASEMSKKGSITHNKSATSSGLVETAESLKSKLKEIQKAIEALENEAKDAADIVNDVKERREVQVDEDPLDAFMLRMTSVQCQQAEALSVKRNEQLLLLRREEARVRDLLKFATSSSLVLKSVSENEIHSHLETSNIDAGFDQRDINLKERDLDHKEFTIIGPQMEVASLHTKKGSTTSGLASSISLFQTHSMPPPPPRPRPESIVNLQLQEQQQRQQSQVGIEVEDEITAKVSLPLSLLSGVGFAKK